MLRLKQFCIILTGLLGVLVWTSCVSATPAPTPTPTLVPTTNIIKLTNGEWSPYTSEQMPHYGLYSHIVSEAFALEGITVEYDFYPWARAMHLVETGQYEGTIPWIITAEREEAGLVQFSPSFFAETCDVFFHRHDFAFDWQTVEDLEGLRIGLIVEYSITKEFETLQQEGQALTLDIATSEDANFQKLLLDRIDIFPATREVGLQYLRQNMTPEEAAQITYHPAPWRCGGLHLVISQQSPRADELLQTFEQGLQKLKDSGRYEQMLQDFVDGVYDAPQN